MKFCRNCGGMMGDNVNTCSVCNYQFTSEDNEKAKREREEYEARQQRQMQEFVAERAKKRLVMSILALSFLIGSILLSGLVASITHNVTCYAVGAFVGMVLEIATIITGMVNGAFRCPNCDTILFKNYGRCCMHCGKRLY